MSEYLAFYLVVKLIQILKRAFQIFITCINLIWAFPFLLILRILKPLILVKFTTILTSRIGHFTIDSSFYLATLPKSSGFPKIYHWFWFSPGISNFYWSSLVQRSLFVRPWVKYLDYINNKLPGGESHIVPSLSASRDKDGLFQGEIERFSISKYENDSAKSWMRKFGWTDNEPFVCLLVRDSEYLISDPNNRGFAESRENWTYHSYRDSDVETYIEGIEYFLARGYWVIRMGKICAKPVPIRNSKFIDYPFLDDQEDLMDIWLSLNAKLFISTGTGIDVLPNVYKTPVSLYLNALPLINLSSSHHMTWVPKYLIWKSTGKYLTLREHLSNHHLETQFYEDAGIQVVDLTSQDILDATWEQEQRLSGSWIDTEDDRNRQRRFWEILKTFPEFSTYHNWIHPEARVGAHFLRKMGDAFFD
ncbi:TIGR04372 family glycosyltransferase [Leptospira weilii]|uniref:TIGR04372 family glycosyltransferase n=1 Tax=Leptospira weilii TaxID=28184 RepID=UPI001E2EA209|nr:TIGR04372 family glycosyltransferase [Leptospira weilii]